MWCTVFSVHALHSRPTDGNFFFFFLRSEVQLGELHYSSQAKQYTKRRFAENALHASARFVCKYDYYSIRFLSVYSRSSAFRDLKDSLHPFIDLIYFIYMYPAAYSRVGVGLWGWVGFGWRRLRNVLSQRQCAANYPDPTSSSSITARPIQRCSGIYSIYRQVVCRPFGRDVTCGSSQKTKARQLRCVPTSL